MILKDLHIAKYSFEPADKPYTATVTYRGESGSVTLNLRPELTHRILAVIADELVESSKDVARNLTASVISQAAFPQLSQNALAQESSTTGDTPNRKPINPF